jgi:hypothetical protein
VKNANLKRLFEIVFEPFEMAPLRRSSVALLRRSLTVEIMLGETDESHIIRTIEYWDNEKRRWPQRQHYAVLVAESITRRFFNVIQLLSHSIPIIAVQVNMIESGGQKALHFSKILDTYEEIDDGTGDGEIYDEAYWKKRLHGQ